MGNGASEQSRLIRKKIRLFFKPIEKYSDSVDRLISKRVSQDTIKVGVHIRIEDYKHWMGGKFYVPLSKYVELCSRLYKREGNIHFFICTTESCVSSSFSEIPHTIGLGSVIEDLYLLSQCDLIVGPPSTFSGWASFYGDVPFVEVLPGTDDIDPSKAFIPYLDDRNKVSEATRWVLHY